MYQTVSQNQERRAEEAAEQERKRRAMERIKALKRERYRYQKKYDEITKVNATIMGNADILIWREIERLNGEIEELQKGL